MDAETLNIFPSQPMHVEPSPKVQQTCISDLFKHSMTFQMRTTAAAMDDWLQLVWLFNKLADFNF
jgi:hypothetical protein